MAEESKFSKIVEENKKTNSTSSAGKDELFQQIRDAINLSKNQRADKESSIRMMESFISTIEKNNSDLLKDLANEDKKLLENVLGEITKLQNKTLDEFKKSLADINKLAESIFARSQAGGPKQFEQISKDLQEATLKERFKAEGLTLEGKDDALKNRLMKELFGVSKQPGREGKPVQGVKESFTNFKSDFKESFMQTFAPKGTFLGNILTSQESRREKIRSETERSNIFNAQIEKIKKQFSEVLAKSSGKATDKNTDNGQETPVSGNAPDNNSSEQVDGKIYSSSSNESAKNIENASRSARDEERAGITDTDPEYSRSGTVAADKSNWDKLINLLKEIRDCVCECNCSDDDDDERRRRRNQQRQRQVAEGSGVEGIGIIETALGAGAAMLGAGATKTLDWIKEKTGFGKVGSSNTTDVRQPSVEPIRETITPNTPATEVTRTPRDLPTPANDNTVTTRELEQIPEQIKTTADGTAVSEVDPNSPAGQALEKQRNKVEGKVEKIDKITPETAANDIVEMTPAESNVIDASDRFGAKQTTEEVAKQEARVVEKNAVNATEKSLVKAGEEGAVKAGEKAAVKVGEKGLVKGIGKVAAKHVPFLGVLAGGYFAHQRWKEGDKLGAIAEGASGILGSVPNLYAQGASLAIDAGLMAKDAGLFGGSSSPTTAGSIESTNRPPMAANDNAAKPSMWNRVKSTLSGTAGTATGMFGTARGMGGKTTGILGKASGFLGKTGKFAGRLLGKAALPLAAGMALYEGYNGWNADPNATTGQKFMNAGRDVLSGLTFGLVDSTEDKIASGEYVGSQISPSDTSNPLAAGMETGNNNVSSAINNVTKDAKIADAPNINVPPPTVIQQPVPVNSGRGADILQGLPPDSIRTIDSSWQRYQNRRAFG